MDKFQVYDQSVTQQQQASPLRSLVSFGDVNAGRFGSQQERRKTEWIATPLELRHGQLGSVDSHGFCQGLKLFERSTFVWAGQGGTWQVPASSR